MNATTRRIVVTAVTSTPSNLVMIFNGDEDVAREFFVGQELFRTDDLAGVAAEDVSDGRVDLSPDNGRRHQRSASYSPNSMYTPSPPAGRSRIAVAIAAAVGTVSEEHLGPGADLAVGPVCNEHPQVVLEDGVRRQINAPAIGRDDEGLLDETEQLVHADSSRVAIQDSASMVTAQCLHIVSSRLPDFLRISVAMSGSRDLPDRALCRLVGQDRPGTVGEWPSTGITTVPTTRG